MGRQKIVITDLRTREAQDALAYLCGEGYDAVSVPREVCLWEESALSAFAAEHAEGLCAVIHPAPPLFQLGFEEADEAAFARARDEGPMAAWCVTKVFGGLFRESGGGSIVYLNSIHAEKPLGRGFLFSCGCAAAQLLSREANQDYGAQNVRTYFVERGPSPDDPDARSELSGLYWGVAQRCPTRETPRRGSLNALLAFLVTPAAAPLAGSDLRADGGMTMYYGQRMPDGSGKGAAYDR